MKTINELREILSGELDALKAGSITIQKAQTTANLVGKFLHTIRLQLEYVKLKQTVGTFNIPSLENAKEATE
jgi:hypothetical protein